MLRKESNLTKNNSPSSSNGCLEEEQVILYLVGQRGGNGNIRYRPIYHEFIEAAGFDPATSLNEKFSAVPNVNTYAEQIISDLQSEYFNRPFEERAGKVCHQSIPPRIKKIKQVTKVEKAEITLYYTVSVRTKTKQVIEDVYYDTNWLPWKVLTSQTKLSLEDLENLKKRYNSAINNQKGLQKSKDENIFIRDISTFDSNIKDEEDLENKKCEIKHTDEDKNVFILVYLKPESDVLKKLLLWKIVRCDPKKITSFDDVWDKLKENLNKIISEFKMNNNVDSLMSALFGNKDENKDKILYEIETYAFKKKYSKWVWKMREVRLGWKKVC